jgi:hypothetical protein
MALRVLPRVYGVGGHIGFGQFETVSWSVSYCRRSFFAFLFPAQAWQSASAQETAA